MKSSRQLSGVNTAHRTALRTGFSHTASQSWCSVSIRCSYNAERTHLGGARFANDALGQSGRFVFIISCAAVPHCVSIIRMSVLFKRFSLGHFRVHLGKLQLQSSESLFQFAVDVLQLVHLPQIQSESGSGSASQRHHCNRHHCNRNTT